MSMSNEQTPLKIVIPPEGKTPFLPEHQPTGVKMRLRGVGKRTKNIMKRIPGTIWRSRARRKVTGGLKRGVVVVATKSNQVVRDTIVRRAKQTSHEKVVNARSNLQSKEWKRDAKVGTAKGLRWASRNLAALAERLNRE